MPLPPAHPAWPIDPPVIVRPFDAPDTPFGPGHRGLDLAAGPGAPVRALLAGRVAFAGEVAGTPVVTIDHGGWRSTYQPVLAALGIGTMVTAGEVIGRTATSGGHCAGHCLHLGVIAADAYRDPLALLMGPPVLRPVIRPLLTPHPGARPADAPG